MVDGEEEEGLQCDLIYWALFRNWLGRDLGVGVFFKCIYQKVVLLGQNPKDSVYLFTEDC